MTEEEWLQSTDPAAMLAFLRDSGRLSERKARLFAVACCRRIWFLMTDHRSQTAVEVAERFADGLANRSEWEVAIEAALAAREENLEAAWEDFEQIAGCGHAELHDNHALAAALICVTAKDYRLVTEITKEYRLATRRPGRRFKGKTTWVPNTEHIPEQGKDNCDVIRELFGNPFRPATSNPAWLTPTVLSLAQATYDNRILPAGILDNARLAVLADALEDADCTEADILGHCRGAGLHTRGCWLVDAILGKA